MERTFHLPEGYGFLARAENIHLSYELVNVAVVGDSHCVKPILNVLLKQPVVILYYII